MLEKFTQHDGGNDVYVDSKSVRSAIAKSDGEGTLVYIGGSYCYFSQTLDEVATKLGLISLTFNNIRLCLNPSMVSVLLKSESKGTMIVCSDKEQYDVDESMSDVALKVRSATGADAEN